MLIELTVKNLALIDSLALELGEGANVLTGETGAGKSILVGALGLLTGKRGTPDLVRAGAAEAEVTALFCLEQAADLAPSFEVLGLEASEEVLLRRVLSATGRSRAYVNGHPVPQAHLGILGEELLAISGQHDQQSLLKPQNQLKYLDRFGHLQNLLVDMNVAWVGLSKAAANLSQLEAGLKEASEKRDLYEFQLEEINKIAPLPGEDDGLLAEKNKFQNGGRLLECLSAAVSMLGSEAGSVVEKLGKVKKHLDKAAALDPTLAEELSMVDDTYHQLSDLAANLEIKSRDLDVDTDHIDWIDERLNTLAKLKRKYNMSLADLLARGAFLKQTLDQLDGAGLDLSKLRREHQVARSVALEAAQKLHQARQEAAIELSKTLAMALKPLGFPRLDMEVRVSGGEADGGLDEQASRLSGSGFDRVEFLFSPNPGEGLKPLAKIASGGELSRVMLAMMTLLERSGDQLMVFDEIDSGLGGATAEAVATTMAELAGRQQIIVITHLPQMAALPGRHFVVSKSTADGDTRTVTSITPISESQRIIELGRMLGGANPSPEAVALASRMLTHES